MSIREAPRLAPASALKTVRDVMTARVRTVGRRQTARVASDIMRLHRIQHLVVVDVAGRVCGVISDRDVRAAAPSSVDGDAAKRAEFLDHLRVDDLMAPNPVTARPADDVAVALRAMRVRKIGCLAVVDELGSPVGIVTGYDVVTLALELLEIVQGRRP